MTYRTRTYYTDSQKALMWERWKEGWTLHQIGQLFDRPHTSIQGILSRRVAFDRRSDAVPWRRCRWHERGNLARAGDRRIDSLDRCTARSERHRQSAARLKRNGGRDGYRATQADSAAWNRALRPKRCKLAENRPLARIVADKLRLLWSPEQVAGWLKHTYPCDESHHVSHETIYRSLFIQARGALKKELLEHLRRTRGMRRSRHYTQKTAIHGQIVGAVSIRERPASRRGSSGAWSLGRGLGLRQWQ